MEVSVRPSFEEIQIPVPFGFVSGKWWGSKDKQPIIAIHGWQDNAGTFDPLIELLPKDLSILCIDLPGHGRSSHIPLGLPYYIFWDGLAILRRIIKHYNWRKVSIMGHSLGAAIGFLYAASYPDDTEMLISIDTVAPVIFDPSEIVKNTGPNIDKLIYYDALGLDKMPSYKYSDMIDLVVDGHHGTLTRKSCEILMRRGMYRVKDNKYLFSRDIRLKGWNDVGFHGSIQIPTPNIDALAYNGVILNRHYVQPTCTPSRAALLTGKYPIRYGLQGLPIIAGVPLALPSTEKILPQYLKDLGYSTHLVGKWHLGANKKNHTPLKRGFDSHFGYWNGFISYRNSTHSTGSMTGKDARRGLKRAGDEMVDQYATDIFTNEANKVIKSCKNQGSPMFLMVSHLAVHTGVPGPNILEVQNKTLNDIKFNYIENKERRLFAGILTSLDESVGSIIESLDNNGMLEDSIVLFISDNGAPADDPIWGYGNSGSNWPLRGEKGAVLDGGVRGVAAIWSPWLKKKHRVSENLFHITDWLPTLYTAAGGNFDDLGQIDGIDQWESLTETSKRMRTMALINIDETSGEEALILNHWKVVKSNRTSDIVYYLKYSGEHGKMGPEYNMNDVAESLAGSRLSKINCLVSKADCMDTLTTYDLFYNIRSQAKIDSKCIERIADPDPNGRYQCFDSPCLFDIQQDPCEYQNIASRHPEAFNMTIDLLVQFKKELTMQNYPAIDPAADPRFFDGYWDTWMEKSVGSISFGGQLNSCVIIILIMCFYNYFIY